MLTMGLLTSLACAYFPLPLVLNFQNMERQYHILVCNMPDRDRSDFGYLLLLKLVSPTKDEYLDAA